MCSQWRYAIGRLACERHTCIGAAAVPKARTGYDKYIMLCKTGKTPFKGVCSKSYSDKSNPRVCIKPFVVHVNHMSRSAGNNYISLSPFLAVTKPVPWRRP